MELALLVWIISILGPLSFVFGLAAFIMFLCTGVTFIVWLHEENYHPKNHLRWFISLWVVFVLTSIAIPSEKTAYTMVGAYAAQKVAEDPKVRDMSGKVLTIIEQKLDTYIEEGLKEAEKKAKK